MDNPQPAAALAPVPMPLLDGDNVEAKRRELLSYFCQTFDQYESLFTLLADEQAWYTKAISLRHPLIFYFGHTAAFFINKLFAARLLTERVDANIEAQVAIGVDEMSWDDLDDSNYLWPTVAELRAYRNKVRQRVVAYINTMPISLPISWDSEAWLILMGIEHERIHLETSSVLIRQLPLKWLKPEPQWLANSTSAAAPQNRLIAVAGAEVTLGKPRHDLLYGWDNEYGQKRQVVAAFRASEMLVSNGEFLQFVEAGGYDTERYWSDEGWAWATFAEARHPSFWVKQQDGYHYRALVQLLPMPWDWPVDVNCHEAQAFCRWKSEQTGLSIQLPSEAEWTLLRQSFAGDLPQWQRQQQLPANLDLQHGASACPVNQFRQGSFFDLCGNVWQWTSTAIDAFEGFQVHPLYDDFSTPTFDGKHNLIKGGSWCSTGNCAIKDSRYAFRRHFFQHAGFRYVESSVSPQSRNPYETDELVAQYLSFHYGAEHFAVANYPQRCAQLCLSLLQPHQKNKALDLGCSVGRASFELAREFSQVDGVDYSARFINAAVALQQQGKLRYFTPTEGELGDYQQLTLAQLDISQQQAQRVHFSQGDACNLKAKYSDYDLVFAGNLIDRLADPAQFLTTIHQRINRGGLLVLTSPYTWLEQYTDKSHWLGGYRENGEAVDTLTGLHRCLDAEFELLQAPQDIAFVIAETARKFQHSLAQCTVWRRR
ncbi:5-histidylcysteine sulfoxide synthase [Ferrimonas senticii]|uniref:5-histidylcysteine sulfoxide synthase n=1 Tax=Ferrimonas senticii TaxID=394566 RepID=UPI00047F70DE|nr:5-histidylcysteine sulfoxide synthase [Ferrimonas senticii]